MMHACQKWLLLFLLISLPFVNACRKPDTAVSQTGSPAPEKAVEPRVPGWLEEKIREFKTDKRANPPVKIYSYLYHFQEVYYISGRCCDIPSAVYDATGKQLCQPDGGITGRGDGKCADFFAARANEKLIWEDLRTE